MAEKIDNIKKILFVLFPISFVSGPLIPEIITLIIFSTFFIGFDKSQLKRINTNIFEIKWFFYFSIMILILSFLLLFIMFLK